MISQARSKQLLAEAEVAAAEESARSEVQHKVVAPTPSPRLPVRAEPKPRWWLRLLVWAAILAGGYYEYTHPTILPWLKSVFMKPAASNIAKGPTVTPVLVANAAQEDFDLYLTGLGTVTADSTVTIRSRVEGELINVAFSEGQLVKQGQLLAQIDPRAYQVRLAELQGKLVTDQATLENARLDLKRYREAGPGSITQQRIDLQAATVRQAEGVVQTDLALIDNAKLTLSYCNIHAPISGRIGLRTVDQGNLVRANELTGLAVITQLQPIAVLFTVPQDEIVRVQRRVNSGEPLVVEAYGRDLTTRLATGTLVAVDNQVDPATGTLRLKAVFPNEDNLLFPNQFVNVRLKVDTLPNSVTVPNAAIQRGPTANYVYVCKPDGTVDYREITLGPSEGNRFVVTSGLVVGETVVTDGVDKLIPGSKVSVATTQNIAKQAKEPVPGEVAKDPL